MIRHVIPAAVLMLCLASQPALANLQAPNWERATALSVARSVDIGEVRHALIDLTIAGSTTEVLDLLQDTSRRADWPGPARDYAIHDFTQELRALPSSVVPAAIMTYLKSYQPATLVPHEEHPGAGIPLFNVRATASGVENGWLRQEALLEGLALLRTNPRSLVDVFLIETHPAVRQGYVATLAQASQDQLTALGKAAARRLSRHVDLTVLAGRAALMTSDLAALEYVFVHGGGPALAPLARDAAAMLASKDSARLLARVMDQARARNAALAMAHFGPASVHYQGTRELLLDLLSDPELGASAALVLARDSAPETLAALRTLEGADDGLQAARARMALEMSRSLADGETPR